MYYMILEKQRELFIHVQEKYRMERKELALKYDDPKSLLDARVKQTNKLRHTLEDYFTKIEGKSIKCALYETACALNRVGIDNVWLALVSTPYSDDVMNVHMMWYVYREAGHVYYKAHKEDPVGKPII